MSLTNAQHILNIYFLYRSSFQCATILKMVSTEPKERPTVAGIRKMLERKFKAVDLQLKKRKRNQKTTSEPTKKSKKNQKKV